MAAHAVHSCDLGATETPEHLRRKVRARASDPGILDKSGGVFTVGDLARYPCRGATTAG
jgi:hypothetical protein